MLVPRLFGSYLALVLGAGWFAFSSALAALSVTEVRPKDVVLLLDNSGSMKKIDPEYSSRNAVEQFLESVPEGTRIAMVIFDKDAKLIAPLELLSDKSRGSTRASLQQLNYRGLLTDIPAAMELAIYELKINGRAGASKSIVLLTDGIVDTGEKASDVSRTRWLREDLAAEAARKEIRVYGVALADQADFELLQSLALTTQGDYFRAPHMNELTDVLDRVRTAIAQHPRAQEPPTPEIRTDSTGEAESTDDESAPEPGSAKEVADPAPSVAGPIPRPSPDPLVRPESTSGPPPATPLTSAAEESVEAQPRAGNENTLLPPSLARYFRDPEMRWWAVGGAMLAFFILLTLWLRARRKSASSAQDAASQAAVEPIPQAYLYDVNGVTGSERHELTSRVTSIGRVAPDPEEQLGYLVISNGTIGRRHALIEYRRHNFWVTDQASRNGTFVNGKRAMGEVCLRHGDRIRFHDAEFEFDLPRMNVARETIMADPDDPDTERYGTTELLGNKTVKRDVTVVD